MKYTVSIHGLIDLLYYPAKVFGMAPYEKRTDENHNRIYVESKWDVKSLCFIGLMATVMGATAAGRTITQLSGGTLTFLDSITASIWMIEQGMTVLRMAELFLKRKSVVTCLKALHTTEKIMDTLKMVPSYKFLQVVLIGMYFLFPLYTCLVVTPLWNLVQEFQAEGAYSFTFWNSVFQLVNLGIKFAIRNLSLYFYTMCVLIAHQRLQSLNEYIARVEGVTKTEESGKKLLQVIADTHTMVYTLTYHANAAFAWSIFTSLSLSFLECIAIALTGQNTTTDLLPLQLYLVYFFNTVPTFSILIPCQMVLNTVRKTRRLICELTIPYFSTELATQRIILLLQVLHENINLSAGGFYPMDMTVITSHVGLLSTLMMFFYKLYNTINT